MKSATFTISFKCSLVVYQYYRHKGFDNVFYKLFRLISNYVDDDDAVIPEKQSSKLHVPLKDSNLSRYKIGLSNKACVLLNDLLEEEIKEKIRDTFVASINVARKNGVKFHISKTINDILNNLNLSEEARSFETTKKDLQRFCSSKGINYKDVKKNKYNSVPKKVKFCRPCSKDGIILKEYLEKTGITRDAFYKYHRQKVNTFKHRGEVYIQHESVTIKQLSFF